MHRALRSVLVTAAIFCLTATFGCDGAEGEADGSGLAGEDVAGGGDGTTGADGSTPDARPEDVAGPQDVPGDDAVPDTGAAGPPDVAADARDAGPDVPPRDVVVAVPCEPAGLVDTAIDLLPDTPAPQLHPDLAFDGHALWLVWNRGEPEGDGFDVWATRLTCDGTTSVPPFRVQAEDTGNDVGVSVAAVDDTVLFLWTADTGGDPNLFVHWRTFGRDGAPRMSTDRTLTPLVDGAPVEASAWEVDLASRPDGGFAVAGAWASPAVERFQAFAQELSADGEFVGPWVTAPAEAEVSQFYPAIAAADGGWLVAWSREPDSGRKRAVAGYLPLGGDALEGLVSATPGDSVVETSRLPDVAGVDRTDGPMYFAFTRAKAGLGGAQVDIGLRDLTAPPGEDGEPDTLFFGEGRGDDHSPTVVPSPDGEGGIVVWFRTRGGVRNDLLWQRFQRTSDGLVAEGEPALLNPADDAGDHPAYAVYGTATATLPGGVVLVAWTERADGSPDAPEPASELRIRGRYLAF